MSVFEVIKFDGLRSRNWMFYKYPSDSIVLGSQLIVHEGQCVIFVKGGTICDVFNPGTYTLSSNNLPILNKLINLPFGKRSPFSAEVYFINTTVKLDITWGTSDPVQLIDPKYYVKLRIRAFGQMGLRINNAVLVFRELIGSMQKSELIDFEKIKNYYKGLLVLKIKSIISNYIVRQRISALEISTELENISSAVKAEITPVFENSGFIVSTFYIQSINFPDEDFEKINSILEDRAAFEIMGDNRYTTKRSFDVYEGAANNENGVAGVFAAGGLGLGTAVGMGSSMAPTIGNPLNNSTQNSKQCPSCNTVLPLDAMFCFKCGYSFKGITCECGAELPSDSVFCMKCGKKVN